MKRILWFVPILAIFLIPDARIHAQEYFTPALKATDVDASLQTDWYGTYLQNKKIGYFKTTRTRAGDTVVDSYLMSMKLVSFGKKVEIKMSQALTFEGKAPYRLMSGTMEQNDGQNTLKIDVKRQDKGFDYIVNVAGQKQTRREADPNYTLPDAMALEMWVRTGPKIGAQIVTKDFDVKDWKVDTDKSKIKAVKTSLVGGVEVKYYEIDNEVRGATFLSRHDALGNFLSGNIAIFEMRKETEEQAKNTQYSQDIFVLGMAKIDRPIGRTTQITELVLKVSGKDNNIFESGPRQTAVVEGNGDRIVKVGKKYANDVKPTAKEIEENLAETTAYPITHAKVQALAKEAVGDAKTPEDKVRRIVRFVHMHIKGEMNANLPNIHDLMDKKKGDCKCYALMTANLCRAAGVPAREVTGLLYMGDDVKAFGGHAWNEVVLNGVWIPVDASLGETEVDAGHICFGAGERSSNNYMNSLGKLSFSVVQSQTK